MDRNEVAKVIGKNIRDLREARKWTRPFLAERAGLSLAQMFKIEHGIHLPSVIILKNISDEFGIYIEGLMK